MRIAIHLSFGVLGAALLMNAATAATVIRMEAGPNGARSLMTVEKGKARMQSEPQNYILIDPSADQYLYILPEARQTVTMNSKPPIEAAQPVKAAKPATVKLVNKGTGPKIAGFATQRYQLFANGKLCLNTYLSREALQRGELKDFLAGFHQLHAKQKQQYRAIGTQYAPCDDAQETLMGRYAELGLAMRTVDADGSLRQEVVSMETGIKVNDDTFQVPEGFKQLTHEEFLRQLEGGTGGKQEPTPAADKPGKS
ncbi:hypothetical protein EDC30_11156 [Paucimonas lemoignei]|uniref:DUF4412 domain-containing protein n=1 Tax=Paucimonas lemoignei TaxID=29443 RepID=A0A4R3HSN4_PAULE|nr:hypothetical protein [Paucimonas lemoignei]TCS35141.1 hypothetical protein EDC30_11156 [Paucimonas lemoignei]